MDWILGSSKNTSLQGIFAAIIIVVMQIAGLTGTNIPKIDPTTNTVVVNDDGQVEFVESQRFDPALMAIAAALVGIGRSSRDNNMNSEGTKIR